MNLTPLKQVTPCVLSFNRYHELRYTLERLLEFGDIWAEIIVADNDSSDGSRDMVKTEFPQVKCLNTGGNLGVAGWNVAFKKAETPWLLSIDDDSHPVVESWGPVCNSLEQGCSAAGIALSIHGKESQSYIDTELNPTCSFSSAGVLLKKSIVDQLGGYDPNLFLFTNEIDWAARMMVAGHEMLRCDSAHVVHRSTPLQRSSWRHAFYYCRNLLIWIMRYAPKEKLSDLLNQYMRYVFLFTCLHRTRFYLKALLEGRNLFQQLPCYHRLTLEQYQQFRIDYRMPFSYLG